MKLYATTTSERATKVQGGEYIDIDIFNGNKDMVATIKVREQLNGQRLVIWHDGDTVVDVYKDSEANKRTKGNQQKGECVMHGVKHCIHCTENPFNTI